MNIVKSSLGLFLNESVDIIHLSYYSKISFRIRTFRLKYWLSSCQVNNSWLSTEQLCLYLLTVSDMFSILDMSISMISHRHEMPPTKNTWLRHHISPSKIYMYVYILKIIWKVFRYSLLCHVMYTWISTSKSMAVILLHVAGVQCYLESLYYFLKRVFLYNIKFHKIFKNYKI